METEEVAPVMSEDKLVEKLYHTLPGMWMTKLVKQGFNYAQHTLSDSLETCERFELLKPAHEKPSKGSKSSKKCWEIISANADDESSSSCKYCLIHGLCMHDSNGCTDLKEFASIKKKKKAAAAAENTKFRCTQCKNCPRKTGSSWYKGYVPRDEENSLVEKKVKNYLRNRERKPKRCKPLINSQSWQSAVVQNPNRMSLRAFPVTNWIVNKNQAQTKFLV